MGFAKMHIEFVDAHGMILSCSAAVEGAAPHSEHELMAQARARKTFSRAGPSLALTVLLHFILCQGRSTCSFEAPGFKRVGRWRRCAREDVFARGARCGAR